MARTAAVVERRFDGLLGQLPAGSSLGTLTTIAVWMEVGICVRLLAERVPPWQIATAHRGSPDMRPVMSPHPVAEAGTPAYSLHPGPTA